MSSERIFFQFYSVKPNTRVVAAGTVKATTDVVTDGVTVGAITAGGREVTEGMEDMVGITN